MGRHIGLPLPAPIRSATAEAWRPVLRALLSDTKPEGDPQVKAANGYLSGDAARIHFGLPEDAELDWLEIRWPDGEVSVVEDLAAGTLLGITRE
jgi:hypothetical protein